MNLTGAIRASFLWTQLMDGCVAAGGFCNTAVAVTTPKNAGIPSAHKRQKNIDFIEQNPPSAPLRGDSNQVRMRWLEFDVDVMSSTHRSVP